MRRRAERCAALVVAAVLLTGCGTATDAAASECGAPPAGFTGREVDVGGATMYAVTGGHGPAVVLLHGFPETWQTWRGVVASLAAEHRVVVPDLLGVGCSSFAPRYDADAMADAVHAVVRAEGVSPVAVVGHDTGGWAAFAYARSHRGEVSHLVLSGAVLPGFGLDRLLDTSGGLPHLAFFGRPEAPESLISGHEREYFGRFIGSETMARSGIVDVYAASYARPGRLTAALGQYRALHDDSAANVAGAGAPLAMPTLALSGGGRDPLVADSLRRVADRVAETAIPGAGHYVQEEWPDEVAAALAAFLR